MQIKLKEEDKELIISDEGFDSPQMWLKLTVEDEKGDQKDIELLHRDLMAALIAFDAKRNREVSPSEINR